MIWCDHLRHLPCLPSRLLDPLPKYFSFDNPHESRGELVFKEFRLPLGPFVVKECFRVLMTGVDYDRR